MSIIITKEHIQLAEEAEEVIMTDPRWAYWYDDFVKALRNS